MTFAPTKQLYHDRPPKTPGRTTSGPFSLRPYQAEALDAIAQAEERGIRRPLVALPTGTGKTVVFAHLIERRSSSGRALILAHRDELLRQARDKLAVVMPGADIGLVKAEADEVAAPVVLASVQTVQQPRRLERLAGSPGGFGTIVVDEAHHVAADSYKRILRRLGAFEANGPLTLGVTATPERADGKPLGRVWQEIVYQRSILEMIHAGYLADLRAVRVHLKTDFSVLRVRGGDFVASEVGEALEAANAPEHVVDAYLEHAAGRKALVFTPTVRTAHATCGAFLRAGVSVEALDGSTPPEERLGILSRFGSGETVVVANCGVLTEGFDEPGIGCVIVARPTRSRPLYVQMIGRGTRPYPGKTNCLVLDLVGATARHDLVTAASLFDVEPEDLAEKTLTDAVAAREAREEAVSDHCGGELIGEVVDLFERRPMAWTRVSGSTFTLSTGAGRVTLEGSGDAWGVVLHERGRPARILASGLPLDYAQGVAEDHVRASGASVLVDRGALWRCKPATDRQRAALRRLGVACPSGSTAGAASDLISAAMARRAGRSAG